MLTTLLTILLISPPSDGPTVTVDLPMEAHVRGAEIELGELASIHSSDAAVGARLAAIELGNAPSPGYSRVLRLDRVRDTLRRRAPDVQINFTGQRATRVFVQVEHIEAASISSAVLQALAAASAGFDTNFAATGDLKGVDVPAGLTGVSLRPRLPKHSITSGAISIPVDVLIDGVVYRTIWTSWQSSVYSSQAVLSRPVKAGETLHPNLFVQRRVLVERGPQGKALAPQLLSGAVAAFDLPAGRTVQAADVHRPAVVVQGRPVYLVVKKGAIEAKVTALALETGSIGDSVRVRADGTGQELVAVIQSNDRVLVDLSR